MGAKQGLTCLGATIVLALWFRLINGGEMSGFANPTMILTFYGAFMLFLNLVLYPIFYLQNQLTVGCTRKHAAYGVAVTSLVYIFIVISGYSAVAAYTKAFTVNGIIMRIAGFLALAGLGSLVGILVDRFGKVAYYIITFSCIFGMVFLISMSSIREIALPFVLGSMEMSLVLFAVSVVIFIVGVVALRNHVKKFEVKL